MYYSLTENFTLFKKLLTQYTTEYKQACVYGSLWMRLRNICV